MRVFQTNHQHIPPTTATDDDSRMFSLVKMTVSQEQSVTKIAPGTVLPKSCV